MGKYLDEIGLSHLWQNLKALFAKKQDKLTGAAGQIVGFGAGGAAKAQSTLGADKVVFSDGKTFQAKYNAGELTGPQGPKGSKGDAGAAGPQGEAGITPTFQIDENGHLIATY